MASSLTFQLLQQDAKHDDITPATLPSPPNSSCGEDSSTFTSSAPSLVPTINNHPSPQPQRRDSLQSHFSTLTLQAISNSLPENYTIDHSTLKATVKALAGATDPITIAKPSSSRRHSMQHSPGGQVSLPALAAATGGLTIRHRRPSTQHHRKHRILGEPSHPFINSLPTNNHRCQDCGKVYKHPSCLTKHRWEHSEEWELTSKLELTKHQQVQMLEAAAILVGMDHRKHDDEWVDVVEDDGIDQGSSMDDDDESIHVDIEDDDDDDISIEMDLDVPTDQEHAFPTMVASTPAMLPSSFSAKP